MKHLVKWLVILGIAFIALTAGFTLYANFLLDYSLDNLEQAVTAADRDVTDTDNPLLHSLYQNITQDLAVEEAFRGGGDNIERLTLLDFASRSFGEAEERVGNKRAGLYLQQMVDQRKSERHPFLRIMDEIYYRIRKIYTSVGSIIQYIQKKISRNEKLSAATSYSSLFLLNQAEQKQKEGLFTEAIELYNKFLELYPDAPEKGFATIALANTLIRAADLSGAQKYLLNVQRDYFGQEEERIATAWLKKISLLKQRQTLIDTLRQNIQAGGDPARLSRDKLQLGLAYLSSYRFEEAVKTLQELSEEAAEQEVKQKASFYLAWAHKMNAQYSQSLEVLNKLSEESGLQQELALGLKAQRADLYYLQNDPEKAISILGEIKRDASAGLAPQEVARQAWLSLSEFEQANIYLFDLGDQTKGRELLGLGTRTSGVNVEDLIDSLSSQATGTAADRAFEALKVGKVNVAFEIFEDELRKDPGNPWLNSGIATVYLLFGEPEQALKFAQKGHRAISDEYTTSILAYVYGFIGQTDKAIELYQSAMTGEKVYAPAQFNLGCLYLDVARYQEAYDLFAKLEPKVGVREKYLRAKVLNNMGFALWRLGRSQEARQQFENALKVTPNLAVARQNLSLLAAGQAPQVAQLKE